jgi:hypothetical protein
VKFGEELPKAMQNKPNLHVGLSLYFNAWFELDLERDRKEAEYIKRSQVFEYARDYELSHEQREDMWFYIQQMDREFLPWWLKRNKPKEPKVPTIPKGRRRGK